MSPFKLNNENSFHIQSDIFVALLPLIIWGVYVFGARCLLMLLISTLASFITELAVALIARKKENFSPIKPIIYGLLSGLILPASAPVWIFALSGFYSAIIGMILPKGTFHSTIINPIAASGIILFSLFEKVAYRFTAPFTTFSFFQISIDSPTYVTTILQSIKNGTDNITIQTIFNVITGRDAGGIGEVSSVLIILGCIYLIIKKYISYHIPTLFIGTLFLLSFFFPTGNCEAIYCAIAETFSGGVAFASVFVAALPSSSPITQSGKIIFGVLCGIVTFTLRRFFGVVDGALFSVALVSCFTSLIDKYTGNKYFAYLSDIKEKQDIKPQKTNLEELLNEGKEE